MAWGAPMWLKAICLIPGNPFHSYLMTLLSKDQTESFCVWQPLPIVKPRRRKGQRLFFIYWRLEAMPPEKLEESFRWLCESWIASWTCAACIVFFYFIHSQLRVSLISLSPTVLNSSLSSQKSLTGTFLSYLPLSLCSPPPTDHSLPPSVSLILSPAALRWLALLKVCRLA